MNSRTTLVFLAILVLFGGCRFETATSVESEWARELRHQQDELLSSYDLQPYVRERDRFIRSEAFDKYFEPVGLIELSNDELMGIPSRVDVDSEGRILISDLIDRKVYLFESDGKLVKLMDPEECHPGFQWFPNNALFSINGDIFVFNGGSVPVFKFGSRGECIGAVEMGNVYPRSQAVRNDVIYAYSLGQEDWTIQSVDSTGSQKSIVSGSEFLNYNRIMGGMTSDIVLFGDQTIGLSQRQSPFVKLISIDDGSERQIGEQPADYRAILEDMKPGASGPSDIVEEMKKVSDGKSTTIGFYALSDEIAMLIYLNGYITPKDAPDKYGLQIIKTDGETLNDGPINFGKGIGHWATKNGLIFQVTQDYDKGPDSFDKNPPVVIYRFIPGSVN